MNTLDQFNLEVNEKFNTVDILKYHGTDENLCIPSEIIIKGIKYKITKILRSAFSENESLKCVEFEENSNVLEIEAYAFEGCKNLVSIKFPKSLKILSWGSFAGCKSLKNIQINENLSFIDCEVFKECDAIESIIINPLNPYFDSRNNCNAIIEKKSNKLIFGCKTTIIPNDIESIGYEAFKNCVGLKELIVQGNCKLRNIENFAFENCINLKYVKLLNCISSIGVGAFVNCKQLLTIDLLEGLEIINDSAFEDCISLESINVPNSVSKIGNSCFKGCINLKTLCFSSNVKIIKPYLFFNCVNLQSIENIGSVSKIDNFAFKNCVKLERFIFPNNLSYIGKNSFENCKSITIFDIPSSVDHIGESAFVGCERLQFLFLPSSIYRFHSDIVDELPQLTIFREKSSESIDFGYTNTRNKIRYVDFDKIKNNLDDIKQYFQILEKNKYELHLVDINIDLYEFIKAKVLVHKIYGETNNVYVFEEWDEFKRIANLDFNNIIVNNYGYMKDKMYVVCSQLNTAKSFEGMLKALYKSNNTNIYNTVNRKLSKETKEEEIKNKNIDISKFKYLEYVRSTSLFLWVMTIYDLSNINFCEADKIDWYNLKKIKNGYIYEYTNHSELIYKIDNKYYLITNLIYYYNE